MPAIGPLIMGGSAVGASLLGRRSAQGASRLSPAEQAASRGQTEAAGTALGQSKSLFGMGMPQLQQAGRYFSTMARGNKAAMTQALAPDIENLQSVYGGTARTLARFLRGPEKDVQMAELERERAGQIGSLFRAARPAANTALANLGMQTAGMATGGAGTAGSIFGQQAGQAQASRFGGANLQSQAGEDFGSLIFNLLKMYSKSGRGGFGGGGRTTSLEEIGKVVPY